MVDKAGLRFGEVWYAWRMHMGYYSGYWGMGFGGPAPEWLPFFGLGLALIVLWSVFWKGLALWHSAQRKEPWWFAIMLVLNTAGILEIIYLFGVAKLKFNSLFSSTRS